MFIKSRESHIYITFFDRIDVRINENWSCLCQLPTGQSNTNTNPILLQPRAAVVIQGVIINRNVRYNVSYLVIFTNTSIF